jgi:protein required for attachment to host cells
LATTWILVGDASRARIFSFEKDDAPWALVEEVENPIGRARTSELVTDRAGRQRQIGPPLEGHMDPAEQESHRFAERLGHFLQKGYDERRFTRLVVAAPPRFLGYLRGVLREVAKHVVASIDKDYTLHDEKELRRLLLPHVPAQTARA